MTIFLILLATTIFILFFGTYITYACNWENNIIPFLLYITSPRPDYNINSHGDFQRLYDTKYKRNYWLLGYYGGGSINLIQTNRLAKEFAMRVGVPLSSVKIDEVLYSRRYKHFKFLYSDVMAQKPEKKSYRYENVMYMLHD